MPLPPGPPGPAFLQTFVYSYWPLELFDWCARRYGDPFTLRLPGFGAFVMVSAPELIKQVFTGDPEQLRAGKANAILEPVVGPSSVLLLDGKPHMRQRRLLLPPFHGERMQAYARLMAEIASSEIDRMPLGSRFAVHPHMQSITLQVILRAVFGLEEGAQMHALGELLARFTEPPPPWVVFLPPAWIRHADLPLSPLRAFFRRRDRVDVALREVIRARRAAPAAGRGDILSLLLEAKDEDGAVMTEDELRDELMTMLLAGHETTATALSWTFAFLLGAPEVEAKLRGELERARGADGGIDVPALASCEYLDAVIKESLRLRPIVPDVIRHVESPTEIAGYEVPAGAYLTPCIHLAHRRAESWPEPDRFRPERFLGARVDPYAWLPFGGGIRRCLGMAFALYEMKVVLGVTLLRARLRLATPRPPAVGRRGVTVAPADGTPIIVDERRPARVPVTVAA
jgi:cytochrome P450